MVVTLTSAHSLKHLIMIRGGSRAAAISKMECFVTIVYGFQPLTIIAKRPILDVAAALDPPLMIRLFILIVDLGYDPIFNFSSFCRM